MQNLAKIVQIPQFDKKIPKNRSDLPQNCVTGGRDSSHAVLADFGGAGKGSQEDRRFSRRTGLFLTQIQQILAEVDGFNVKRKRKDVLFILRCTSTWCSNCVKSLHSVQGTHRRTGDLAGE